MTEYIYVRKCEFVGNDDEIYYWFYDTDENGDVDPEGSMSHDMTTLIFKFGFCPTNSKHSKVKFVKKDYLELMKLKRKSKVKQRFKSFLKDEEVWFSYWMNFKEKNINNKIDYPEDYISDSFHGLEQNIVLLMFGMDCIKNGKIF